MTVVTREDVYNKMVTEERPRCPYCGKEMAIWECPPINFSDGLGWGSPYLYVCFNDDCSLYLEGWKDIMEKYGNVASYRCVCDPMSTSRHMDCMPVFSRDGGKGYLIDEEVKAQEEARREAEERGLAKLQVYYDAGDADAMLMVLLAEKTVPKVRLKAAEMIGEIGGLNVIEPIRNYAFENDLIKEKAEASMDRIHKRNYTKECPFCAEIIKARAVVCKHCGKELTLAK
jgi:hypothetical protein